MVKVFSSNISTFDRAMRTLGIMMIVALLVVMPIGVGGNEDLEVIDRSSGTANNAKLGWNITAVGDVNGDGDEDYIIGAPGQNMAYVFEGPMPLGFTMASANWRISGPSSSNFGWAVDGIGDYDGDGRDDIIIGAPGVSKAYIFKGRSSGSFSISYSSASIVLEGGTDDYFGHSVSGIDYSNTSYYYAAVGAPQNTHFLTSIGQYVTTGAVFLFNLTYMHGAGDTTANTTVANFTFQGEKDNGWFGFTTVNLGDINDDGVPDLGIGDPFYNNTGEVDNGAFYIQYGKDILFEVPIQSSSNMDGSILGRGNSRFGWFARGVQDVTPTVDNIDDFIVGAPFEDSVGSAHLFYGKTGTFDLQLSATINADCEFRGGNSGDRFGWSADRTMIDRTSLLTLTIGAPGYDNGTMTNSGAVYSFWSWNTLEFANFSSSKYYGDGAGDNLGYSVGEVYYRTENPDWLRIITSSPYDGTSDTGKVEILKRNRFPVIRELLFSPPSGNMNTQFEITMNYTDPDGDPPENVEVDVFMDSLGQTKLATLRLNHSHGTGYTSRMVYSVTTRLPNSILDKNDANKPLYLKGATQALRGSKDIVNNERGLVRGPVVDGIAPSGPIIDYATGQPGNNLDEGTFKMDFEWPEENNEFRDTAGKVKKLYIALREGVGNTITEDNWNDTNPYNSEKPRESFNLSTGRTVYYRIFQFGDIQAPFTKVTDYIVGDDQILFNPNYVGLKPRMNYSVALRAVDESDNWGPLSNVLEVETYWRRPDIPPKMDVFLKDDMEDVGGYLNMTWNQPKMLEPDDIGAYWFYVDKEAMGNYTDIEKEPDYIITRDDDYETFFDNFLVIDHYFDSENVRQDLANGEEYYAAGMAVNWLGQFLGIMEWSTPEKVIGENVPAIPVVKDLIGENFGDNGNQIKLTWQATNDAKFVEYQIYGSKFSFNDIDNAVKIDTIYEIGDTEYIVEEISGEPISQASYYFFTVLVKDHNGHMLTDIELLNNTTPAIKTVAVVQSGVYPQQVKGVSLLDRGNDGGGVLSLSWFALFNNIIEDTAGGTTGFWQYNVYFSDSEITDTTTMEPTAEIRDFRTRALEISDLDGEPVIDGKYYFVAVTMVDWNLVENPILDINNMATKFSINQSDHEAPSFFVDDFLDFNRDVPALLKPYTNITVEWIPASETDVQDFQYYLVKWTGPRSGERKIYDRSADIYTIEGLLRGDFYWVNVTIIDLNNNFGTPTGSLKIPTGGFSVPPDNLTIQINVNDVLTNFTENGESAKVDKEDVYIVFFTGSAEDDFTSFNRLIWTWNITTPGGTFIEKNSRSWDLEVTDPGDYAITLVVSDDEGGVSEPLNIKFTVTEPQEEDDLLVYILIPTLIVVLIVAVLVVLFVMMSGKKSQQNQMIEQYEERKKDIETMEPIYTNLPTWTCDCGTTQVALSENAYCNACYQSHEAVPIDNLDEYLTEHDLVLTEMKVDVPPGWQGQDMAIESSKKDLEDRKERAMKALNEEFAIWLKGTEYESEIPVEEAAPEQAQAAQPMSLHHEGAIIPGQMPPSTPTQAAPIVPTAAQPMPMGQQPPGVIRPPGQPAPIQPIRPPVPGQPQQRPPVPPQQ